MTSPFLLRWAAAAVLCAAPTAKAERPLDLFDLGAPSFATFSARDGVPEDVAANVQVDRDGFTWMSSAKGLARYDGHRWNAIDPPAIPGILGTFLLDHDGTLWVAFRDRGIARYENGRWQRQDSASGLPSDRIRRVAETCDPGGRCRLWLATFDAGLWQRESGRWVPAAGNGQLPPTVLSVAQTHSLGGRARLWVGSGDQGLWYLDGDRWIRWRDPAFAPVQVEDLLVTAHDDRESLWISTFGSGLARIDGDGVRTWTKEAGELPTNSLYSLARTQPSGGGDVVWAASRYGLLRVRDDHAVAFGREHGLPSNIVRSVSAWRSPNGVDVLWLATENGVARSLVGASPWRTAALFGTHGGSGVFGALVEPDGAGGERLWVASSGDGLHWYERGVWHRAEWAERRPPESDARMIKRTQAGHGPSTLWAAVGNGELARVRSDHRLERTAVPWPIAPGEGVLDVLERRLDGRDELWVATRMSGLFRRRDGRWDRFLPGDGSGIQRVTALAAQTTPDGRSWLWATSLRGLMRIDDRGAATTLAGTDGLRDEALIGISLLPDGNGRPLLWIGTGNSGILRIDAADPLHPRVLPADLPAAPDPTAYGALRDAHGTVYICTNNGVQMLQPAADGWTSRVYTRADGVAHDECNANAQIIDARGRYWTGTLGGLAVFDPARSTRDDHPKPLALAEVRVDGQRVDNAGAVRLPPGRHALHVGFGLLSWQRETESAFRTQVLGIEAAPTPWTYDAHRDVEGLPPGRYRIRVEARDYAGNESIPLELPIEVEAFWWQRTLAHAAFAVAGLLLAYALLRSRTRGLEAQRARLAEQVHRRTAELHEANARLTELSYRDALTGLANRRRLREALDARVAGDGSAVALLFADVDWFKEYNDRHGHPAGDEALRGVAECLLACVPANAVVARYGGEEFACLLDGGLDMAHATAERMRASIARRPLPIPGSGEISRVTASIGVAARVLLAPADVHELLREVDAALYRAKDAGRNCVRG